MFAEYKCVPKESSHSINYLQLSRAILRFSVTVIVYGLVHERLTQQKWYLWNSCFYSVCLGSDWKICYDTKLNIKSY